MTRLALLTLKLGFGIAVLALIAWLVDLSTTMRTLRSLDLAWLAVATICYLAIRVLMGIKWWALLGGRNAVVSYPVVQRAMLLSDYHGLLFPNTLAVDTLRAVLLRHHPRGLTFMAASIVADRLINLAVAAAVALSALAGVWLLDVPGLAAPVAIAVAAVAGSVLAGTLAVMSRRLFDAVIVVLHAVAARGRLAPVVDKALHRVGMMHQAARTMLTDPRTVLRAILLSLAVVLLRALWIYFLFRAIDVDVSPLWLVTLMPVITMIALLPLTVLGLGLKDGAFVYFFGGIGVATSAALAVSLSSYAVIIGSNLVLGLLATVLGPPLPKPAAP